MPFFCIHISQGSVATCLKRGGIFKHDFVANLLPSRLVKNFENRVIISEVMAKSLVSCFFWLIVYIVSSRVLKCSLHCAQCGFYRAANAIFKKVGRVASSGVDPGGRARGAIAPSIKYTWARASFHPLKVLAELQKIAPKMHHESPFWDPKSKNYLRRGLSPLQNIFGLTPLVASEEIIILQLIKSNCLPILLYC